MNEQECSGEKRNSSLNTQGQILSHKGAVSHTKKTDFLTWPVAADAQPLDFTTEKEKRKKQNGNLIESALQVKEMMKQEPHAHLSFHRFTFTLFVESGDLCKNFKKK